MDVQADTAMARRLVRLTPSKAPIDPWPFAWYALETEPVREMLARLFLERAGFVTFCPMVAKYRHRNRFDRARRQKTLIEYPLIPRMIFLGMSSDDPPRWADVYRVPMVKRVVGLTEAGRLDPLPTGDLYQSLMRPYAAGRFVAPTEQRHMRTRQEFARGDVVEFASGPMEGERVRVHRLVGERAEVFGEMFGTERIWTTDIANLVPADDV